MPALDGIRALAVVAVLLFHGQMPWAVGGFLGVSVFFTLSGYLITSVVLAEHSSTGRVDPMRFWGRRFRRLAPASLTLLAVLLVVGAIWGISHRLVDDIRAAALYVANWWSIHTGSSYADIFANPSPTEHFWSLAIEEQFYVVFPVVAWWCLRGRNRVVARRRFALVLAVGAIAGVVVGLVITDPNRIYLGTDTRMPELLVGALLAFVWPLAPGGRRQRRLHPAGTLVGVAAAIVLAGACWRTTIGDSWLDHGGLPAISLASAALIAAATRRGPIASVLSLWPLRRLGQISYGVNLFHWPIFVWLDQRRTGWSSGWLLLGRTALTIVLAALSYRLIEEPIRRRRRLDARQAKLVFAGVLTVVLVGSFAVPTVADDHDSLVGAADGGSGHHLGLVGSSPTRPAVTSALATTTTVPPLPVIALAGDSVPTLLAQQIGDLAPRLGAQVLNLGIEACDGALGAPTFRYGPGRVATEDPTCEQWQTTWPPLLEQYRPRALVFVLGASAVLDRKLNGTWTHACRADFDTWYHQSLLDRIDWTAAHTDATVMLTISPWAEYGTLGLPSDHQDRTDCLDRIYEKVLAERPAVVRVDLRDWLCPKGRRSCQPIRSDGIHYRGEGATTMATWLIPQVLSRVGG